MKPKSILFLKMCIVSKKVLAKQIAYKYEYCSKFSQKMRQAQVFTVGVCYHDNHVTVMFIIAESTKRTQAIFCSSY